MKFGSLFSGIGGLDLGFERAGLIAAWQCEIDGAASRVLKNHWPNVPNIGDVQNVGRNTVEPIDVLCGGFPCQDVSIAGKRAGLAGERSGLWFEFARVIDELGPRTVVIENVPGLLSSNDGRDFAVIVHWMVKRGYGVCWRVLDAQYFGVPQRRRRVFIVGSLGDGRAAEILFEREGMSGNIESFKAQRQIAPSLFASGAGTSRTASAGNEADFCIPMIAFSSKDDGRDAGEISPTLRSMNYDKSHVNGGGQVAVVMAHGQANAEIVSDGSPSLTRNHEAPILWQFHNQDSSVRVQEDTLPTVATQWGTGGNNMPFVGVRRLTPVECERLQGFPDNWTAGQADTARYRQLGNAVAVPVAEWIGRRIMVTQ